MRERWVGEDVEPAAPPLFDTQPVSATLRAAPPLAWQALNFAVVGLSGTAISFVLLTLLHKSAGWNIIFANVIAYSAGIVNNYVLNRYWTFRHVQRKSVLHQGGQFALVSAGGLLVHTATLTLAMHAGVHYLIAFAGATVLAFVWNFSINHRFTFRHKAPAALHALAHSHRPHPHHDISPIPLRPDAD